MISDDFTQIRIGFRRPGLGVCRVKLMVSEEAIEDGRLTRIIAAAIEKAIEKAIDERKSHDAG